LQEKTSMVRAGSWTLALVLTVVLVACTPGGVDITPDDDGGVPVGHDAQADSGNPPGHATLAFTWAVSPAPPANVGPKLAISEVRLALRDVRAIGDSATGDDRTSVGALDLKWGEDSPPPMTLSMPLAPPGLYSQFEFRIQGSTGVGYELKGTFIRGNDPPVAFEIHDSQFLPISLALEGLSLDVGETRTIEIRLDVAYVLDAIDWGALADEQDGAIEIDETNPHIGEVRTAIAAAYSARVLP
jgi:hypothetical protein